MRVRLGTVVLLIVSAAVLLATGYVVARSTAPTAQPLEPAQPLAASPTPSPTPSAAEPTPSATSEPPAPESESPTPTPTPTPTPPADKRLTGSVKVLEGGNVINRYGVGDGKPRFAPGECRTDNHPDIAVGAQVTVLGASGDILAIGKITSGKLVDTQPYSDPYTTGDKWMTGNCLFEFQVGGVPSDRKIYSVAVATYNPVSFTRAELQSRDWRVALSIG